MIPKAFFSKGMGTFCRKSGGRVVVASSPHISLPPVSSFRAKREIFLTQRSNGERQMRSSRSTHAILSLPHKYRVPLRRKRVRTTLGMTIREAGYLTWLFIRPRRRLPLRGSLSSAFGAPLLQGATPLACKSATPKRHSLPDGKVNEMRIPLPHQKPSPRGEGAPKGRIGYWRYESEGGKRLKQAENESTAFPVSSFRAKREIFLAHRSSDEREMRSST